MNMNDVAVLVTKLEGGKVNVSIAQIKELLKLVAWMIASSPETHATLFNYGLKKTKIKITYMSKKPAKKKKKVVKK